MLTITNLTKKFSDKVIFENLNLQLQEGLVYTIFGANGSGKSTLLNIICGLDSQYSGSVYFNANIGEKLGFVFQNYNESIMPWLSVNDNLQLALGDETELSKQQIDVILKVARINHLGNRKAHNLSGGQKQLICILRSLINQPQILLMDEPFSAIDYINTRRLHKVYVELLQAQLIKPITIIVTHDPVEAIILGDRVLAFDPTKPDSIMEIFTQDVTDYEDPQVLALQKQILAFV